MRATVKRLLSVLIVVVVVLSACSSADAKASKRTIKCSESVGSLLNGLEACSKCSSELTVRFSR
jgi:major membrane immunogen (membrane-anchored lipoprotein)